METAANVHKGQDMRKTIRSAFNLRGRARRSKCNPANQRITRQLVAWLIDAGIIKDLREAERDGTAEECTPNEFRAIAKAGRQRITCVIFQRVKFNTQTFETDVLDTYGSTEPAVIWRVWARVKENGGRYFS